MVDDPSASTQEAGMSCIFNDTGIQFKEHLKSWALWHWQKNNFLHQFRRLGVLTFLAHIILLKLYIL